MRIATDAKGGQWIKATNIYEKIMAAAATKAMRQAGKEAVTKGRARITAAGFSSAFARTLQAINKPKSGYALNPGVYIHTTVNYADVFEKGATIRGAIGGRSASPYLWLPFPEVPPMPGRGVKFGGIVGRAHMTPSQYVRNVGPLFTVHRPGKLPLLAAEVETGGKLTRRRLRGTFLRSAFGEKQKETRTVFLFFAVNSITIPSKFDVHSAIETEFEQLNDFYQRLAEPYDGKK